MEKTPEKLYQERKKRIEDAIQLRVPDRVPIVPFFHFFPARYAGISFAEAMYDYDKVGMASKKTIMDFQPDMYVNPYGLVGLGVWIGFGPGKWPNHAGHGRL